jgi:hypothetical protein
MLAPKSIGNSGANSYLFLLSADSAMRIPRKMQEPNQNQHFMVLTAENMAEYSEIRLGVPEDMMPETMIHKSR